MKSAKFISIGVLATRTGTTVSAIRFYADKALIPCVRAQGGKRMFKKEVIRRVSFILIAQQLGYTLEQIEQQLSGLPSGRTPTKRDWEKLSHRFSADLNEKIEQLTQLRDSLSTCIGCGCLSLKSCHLYNSGDVASQLGAGPRYLLGDKPASKAVNKIQNKPRKKPAIMP